MIIYSYVWELTLYSQVETIYMTTYVHYEGVLDIYHLLNSTFAKPEQWGVMLFLYYENRIRSYRVDLAHFCFH
jgi:hypothetical protein